MNKQIRELAEQAFKGLETDPVYAAAMIYASKDLEKFAELIVAECGKVIVNGGYWNPALGEKHPLTPPEIATMIREHFGVKE